MASAKLRWVTDPICTAIQWLWTERLKLPPCPRVLFQIEALEARQLLSVAPHSIVSIDWNKINPTLLALTQQSLQDDPRFAKIFFAECDKYGIPRPPLVSGSISVGALGASLVRLHGRIVRPHVLHPTKPALHKLPVRKPQAHKPTHRPVIHKPTAHRPAIHKPFVHKPGSASLSSASGHHVLHSTGGLNFHVTPFTSTLPVVTGTVLNYNSGALPQQLIITFNEPVSANSWSAAVPVQDVSTGATLALTDSNFSSAGNSLTISLGAARIPDGNFIATLNGSLVMDTSGNKLAGTDGTPGDPYTDSFFLIAGDTNNNAVVDITDYNTLESNFGITTGGIWSKGDFTYDGKVNSSDYFLLHKDYGENLSLPIPTGVQVNATTSSTVSLSWTAINNSNVTGYDVLRNGTFLATVNSASTTTYTDTGLSPNTTYTYTIESINSASQFSPPSFPAVTALTAPAAPTNLAAVANSPTRVSLSWTAPAGTVTGYQVERSTDGVNFTAIATNVSGTSYIDTTAQPITTYSYRVRAANTGGLSDPSNTAQVTTPAFDAVAPTAPTNLTATAVAGSDSSLNLSWAPATDNVGITGYEIDRNGVQVGATTASSFTDTGLDAGQTYQYAVIASDAAYNRSPAATANGTTNADTTPPDAPVDLQVKQNTSSSVTLTWVQPWDNVGVTRYNVYRNGVLLTNPPIATASFPDSGLSAGTPYTYAVTALDSALNVSSAASLSVTTANGMGAPPVDQAPNQYIPASWLTDFYGNLTKVLRQRMARVSTGAITPPSASGWLDLGYNSQSNPGGAFVLSGMPTANEVKNTKTDSTNWSLVPASNVVFHDLNGNHILDTDESAWIPRAGNNTGTYQAGDTVVSGAAPPVGTPSSSGSVYFADPNNNIIYDPPIDTLVPDPTQFHGTPGMYDYRDLAGTGHWAQGDPVWIDSGQTHTYQSNETIIYNPDNVQVPVGTWGKDNGIYFYDVDGKINDRIVWANPTNFRQDFAAFYGAMDQLILSFANPSGTYPNDAWSAGALLQQIGVTPTAGNGTITVQNTGSGAYAVSGVGTHFTTGLTNGDSIEIGGIWCAINWNAPITDTQLTLAQPYVGSSVTNASFSVINWTRIPGITDSGTGLNFSYQRGEPDQNSLVFPQQFQQLHDALSQLNTFSKRYGQWLFDSQTSQSFIQVSTETLNAYQSLYGAPVASPPPQMLNGKAAFALETAINAGDADPGSVFGFGLLYNLRLTVEALEGVYVRNPSDTADHGWQMEPDGNGGQYGPISFSDPHELNALLPATTTALAMRLAGQWSTDPMGLLSDSSPIDPIELSEIDAVCKAITANGLWIRQGGANYIYTNDYSHYLALGNFPGSNDPAPWTPLNTWPAFPPDPSYATIVPGQVGYLDYSYDQMNAVAANDMLLAAEGFTVQANLPSATNAGGGANVTVLAIGPQATDVDVSGWTWGTQPVISLYTSDQILSVLEAYYPPPYALPALPPGGTTGSNSQPTTYPHLGWNSQFANDVADTQGIQYHYILTIFFQMNAPQDLYGLVPDGNTFNYTPTHSPQSPYQLMPVPTDPLPLTTQMDYQNVVPDTNLDGIVQVPQNLQSFGNDTGAMAFQPERDSAQSYLPIYTDNSGNLPISAYITQGAFGTSANDVGALRSDAWTLPNEDENGTPYAYSLDTRIRLNLLVNDSSNHIKRVEVIRPGGNAVVFNFTWNPATNSFSPTGVPMGWNGRDAGRTYVLRDLMAGTGPDHESSNSLDQYALEFSSGITQTFSNGFYGGGLSSVSDANTGLSQPVYSVLPYTLGHGSQDSTDSSRYNMTLNWANGQVGSIDYQTKDASQTIHSAITYGSTNPDITALTKTDNGAAINPFSFTLSSPSTITSNGVTVTRSGSFASGSVTLKTTLPGDPSLVAGSYVSDAYTFNSSGLPTADTTTLSEDGSTMAPAMTTATTSWQYATDTGTYANGAPKSGKVSQINYADGSWEAFVYDPTTGWMTEDVTPFKSSTWSAGSEASQVVQYLGYDASQSGNGLFADQNNLVERPRTVTTKVQGTMTAETFNDYGNSFDVSGTRFDGPADFITRHALNSNSPTWATAGLFSDTQITAFDAASVVSATGNLSETKSPDSQNSGSLDYNSAASWFGNPISQSLSVLNPFDKLSSGNRGAVGTPYSTDNSPTSGIDGFGRVEQQNLTGGLSDAAIYTAADWFGPSSVTETDGSTTKYTYSPLGQVATKIVYAGTSHSVKSSYVYDAAGNVVSLTDAAVDAGGNPVASLPPDTTTWAYDAQGRKTKMVENAKGTDATAKRTTTWVYSAEGTTTTITHPDGSTEIQTNYLDGSPASVSGTAVTPASYNEGVITTAGTDANGNPDANVLAGSTWTKTTSGGTANTTITYTNVLGQQYLVQQSGPMTSAQSPGQNRYADATTSFDGNDRPSSSTGFDGTTTDTIYDPLTGRVGAAWVDMNHSGVFAAGLDPKSIEHPTALSTSASTPGGSDSQDLSTSGAQDNNSTVTNGGLNSSQTVDGMTSTEAVSAPTGGSYTDTTTKADGTKRVDTYTDGLLTQEQTLGTTGAVITTINNVYNGLRQLSSTSDYTGTTTYTYLQDGIEQSVTLPGHNPQTVTAVNAKTEDPTSTTRAEGSIATSTENPLGQQDTQSGAGQLPARFGYDVTGTGAMTSLKTFQGNTLDGTGAGTAGWNYDQATGQLYQKTWADNSQDVYTYNTAGQLKGLVMPGITASSFVYNNAGELTSSSLTDGTTGTVSTSVNTLDDLGRALSTTAADNGSSNTTTNSFTALGDPNVETFSSAGNASVGHGYYPTAGTPSTGSPDAPASLTLNLPNAQTPAQTGYAYDPSSKRLQTITINGVNITIGYLAGSNQIQTITAGKVTTALTPDASDPARLGSLSVSNNSTQQSLYAGSFTYNELDQRTSDTISRVNVANDGTTSSESAGYTYIYDPSHADALTTVKDSHGNVLYSYSYDGVGNFTGSSLGTASTLNQYSSNTYNSRGDVTDNGTYTFAWDASDRPISVTPKSVAVGSLQVKLGYDSSDRWLWKDVYQWNGSAWVYDYSRHAVWDGSNLVAELDQNNTLVKGYTWGPTGLLAVTDYTNPAQPKTYMTIADASGNIVMLVDPVSGSVAASYHYDPYGNLLSATGPQAGLSSFLGKGLCVHSELPGLMWADHRVTDGKIWLSRDPSGESSDPNLYRLYGDDPINNVDLTGMTPIPFNGISEGGVVSSNGRLGSGIGAQLELFQAADLPKSPRVQIGWVYTATGVFNTEASIYTGKATYLADRLLDPEHGQEDFLKQTDREISVRPIYGDPKAFKSDLSLQRAQWSQEQVQIDANGWEMKAGPNGETILNRRVSLSRENAAAYQREYNTGMGDAVTAVERGSELDPIRLSALDRAVGTAEPINALPSKILGGETLGVNGAFALLQLGTVVFDDYEETMRSQYAMAPLTEFDAGGTFTIAHGYDYNWFGWHRFNEKWLKQYQSGPKSGQTIDINAQQYDRYKEQMQRDWGYIDFWGHFQPGLFRSKLPEFQTPSKSEQMRQKYVHGQES